MGWKRGNRGGGEATEKWREPVTGRFRLAFLPESRAGQAFLIHPLVVCWSLHLCVHHNNVRGTPCFGRRSGRKAQSEWRKGLPAYLHSGHQGRNFDFFPLLFSCSIGFSNPANVLALAIARQQPTIASVRRLKGMKSEPDLRPGLTLRMNSVFKHSFRSSLQGGPRCCVGELTWWIYRAVFLPREEQEDGPGHDGGRRSAAPLKGGWGWLGYVPSPVESPSEFLF